MSLRLEEKIFIKDLNIFKFKKWLFANGAKILYPKRIVNSIYFDNELKMYSDSIEGTVPRKKIRIRTYDNKNFLDCKKFSKETKKTYFNCREKKVKVLPNNSKLLHLNIYDYDYGVCKPILNVVYVRSYFKLNDIRITIDEDINYYHIKNRIISVFGIQDKEKVVELKSTNIHSKDYLMSIIPLPRSRFSKYCRGVELLKIC